MTSPSLQSWGRFPRAKQQSARALVWQSDALGAPAVEGSSLLPYGQGRSYGDACLNDGGTLLTTSTLDRFLGFDPLTGLIRCEGGVTLASILKLVSSQGWFLPVTPGTKFVSVGGAIANDVHGKNHHWGGTFGCHVPRFLLLRSDGERYLCSATENPSLYGATMGGLGLTGVILWADVQLKRMSHPFLLQETVPFENLARFFEVAASSEADFEYTMSWVDCLSRGKKLGRGLFYRGNHAPPQFDRLPLAASHLSRKGGLSVPFDFPGFALNRFTVKAFNWAYYNRQRGKTTERLVHYDPFFYPLDSIHHWNRIYGRRGFLQFQCVVPFESGDGAMREILDRIARSGMGSFLAVLKTFGDVPSPGWLSFPRKGVTLALDFANEGKRTQELFTQLDRVTREAGGAVYPAKDACMPAESFRAYFPRLADFTRYVDPAFSSSFWRRVTS